MIDFYSILTMTMDTAGCASGAFIWSNAVYLCYSREHLKPHFNERGIISNLFFKMEQIVSPKMLPFSESIPAYDKYLIAGAAVLGCAAGIATERTILGAISNINFNISFSHENNEEDSSFFSFD